LPSKFIKRCHNQADIGLRKAGKALEMFERKKGRKKERRIVQSLSNVVTTRLAKA